MINKNYYIENANVSRFMIPFYLDPVFEKKNKFLFNTKDWERTKRNSVYLTEYIREIYRSKDDGICVFYNLKKESWNDHKLPVDVSKDIQIEPHIISEREDTESEDVKQPYRHTCRLIDINAAYFLTGIGFLFFDIRHGNDASLKEIVNTCFALSNIFSEYRDTHEAKVKFICDGQEFSMRDAVNDILKIGQQPKDILDTFPTSKREMLATYHRLFRLCHEEEEDKLIYLLIRGLHSDATIQKEKYDFLESDFRLSPNKDTMWRIGSNSAASISYKNEENLTYLTRKHPPHIDVDYFLIYLFAMHEREILLKYNHEAVCNWNAPAKLASMKDKLVRFNIWFSYNAVSIESAYQNFYECMYRALKLDKLEKDIQDVITQVNESAEAKKELKINAVLNSVAVLALLSVLVDGLSMVDRLYDMSSFRAGHYTVIGLVLAVLCSVVIYFWHKKK